MKTYPPTPPTRIETWLTNLDGIVLAAVICGTFAVIVFACMIPGIRARLAKPDAPTRTRAVTSGRKSGRVSL